MDLRNAKGKYGASFEALAGIMQIAQQVQQRNRATRVQNQLLTGIAAGESMQNVIARIQKGPDATQDKGFLGNLMHIITAPFNPSLESSFPGQGETDLVQSFIRQRLSDPQGLVAQQRRATLESTKQLIERRKRPTTAATDTTQQQMGRLLTNRDKLLEEITVLEDDGFGGKVPVKKTQIQPGMESTHKRLTDQIIRLGGPQGKGVSPRASQAQIAEARQFLDERNQQPTIAPSPSVRPSPIQRSLQSILPTLSKQKQELIRQALANGFSEAEILEGLR